MCYGTENAEYEEGNLILSDTKRAIPYATYVAKRDIIVYSSGDSLFSSSKNRDNLCDIVCFDKAYKPAFEYFKENIEIIKKQVIDSENIPKNLEQTLYRGLFTDIFSVFELFLSDVILCLIYNCDDKYYKNAVDYFIDKSKKSNKSIPESIKEIETEVHKLFYTGIVYHRFDQIKSIFKKLFDLKIPKAKKEIEDFLEIRNNIVHRYSYSNLDRENLITLSKQDILDWISVVETFVVELVVEIENKV